MSTRLPSWPGVAAIALLAMLAGTASAQDADDAPHGPPPEFADDPKFRAALQACAAEQGLPPPPAPGQAQAAPDDKGQSGQKQQRPDRKKMQACMSGKGFEPPHRDRGPPPRW